MISERMYRGPWGARAGGVGVGAGGRVGTIAGASTGVGSGATGAGLDVRAEWEVGTEVVATTVATIAGGGDGLKVVVKTDGTTGGAVVIV
jgi:hypothetical protein